MVSPILTVTFLLRLRQIKVAILDKEENEKKKQNQLLQKTESNAVMGRTFPSLRIIFCNVLSLLT